MVEWRFPYRSLMVAGLFRRDGRASGYRGCDREVAVLQCSQGMIELLATLARPLPPG
jgi:hypothetical protein